MVGVGYFADPSGEQWIDSLGVEPEPVEPDGSVYRIDVQVGLDEVFSITVDVPGSSVRIIWIRSGESLVDIFRESARRIVTESGGGEAYIEIYFEEVGLSGTLQIRVLPSIQFKDSLLFS